MASSSNVLLLDPVGDAPVPETYQLIDNDVAWLRAAAASTPPHAPKVLVRGQTRADWAYKWWRAQGGYTDTCHSPAAQLCANCPGLTAAQAQRILAEAGDGSATTASSLAAVLYPNFAHWLGALGTPTTDQARRQVAQWLTWLSSRAEEFPPYHLPLLAVALARWAPGYPASSLLCTSPSRARQVLAAWLGYAELLEAPIDFTAALTWAGEFPLSVTPWLSDIRTAFAGQVAALLSTAPATAPDQPLLVWWRAQLARAQRSEVRTVALDVINQQLRLPAFAAAATGRLVEELERSPLLIPALRNALRQLVPPLVPSAPPADPVAALRWAVEQYLPYRQWQVHQPANAAAAIEAQALARQFSDWYLATYPAYLVGTAKQYQHQYWSLRAQQAVAPDECVLWIIADGLGWDDAMVLQKLIVKQAAGRLKLAAATPCFGLLPTITSHTKRAVRWAVPLAYAANSQAQYFNRLPKPPADMRNTDNLADAVSKAAAGQLLVWQPLQPDEVYHQSGNPQTIRNQAEGALHYLANSIAQAVAAVPASLAVRVLLTTDHGRLLSESPRTLVPIAGFTGHGRVAYRAKAPSTVPIPRPEGADDTETICWLDPERYRLPDWVAIARSDASFKIVHDTGIMRGGTDLFPHGGAWPEEVVVPWIELHSHLAPLFISGNLSGEARSNRAGSAQLRLVNSSSRIARLRQVTVTIPRLEPLVLVFDVPLPGSGEVLEIIDLPRWPDTAQAGQIQVIILVETPDGEQHTFALPADLRSTDLRQNSANPLDDLY